MTSAATLPITDGFWAASTRDSTISFTVRLPASTVPRRSTMSPRDAGTETLRISLASATLVYVRACSTWRLHSRSTMTAKSANTTTPITLRRRSGREGVSSGEATTAATLTLRRGRMRGWRGALRAPWAPPRRPDAGLA